MSAPTRTAEAQADRRRRQHLMEGSFAQAANCHHFKRARCRRLWRQQIQDWLIAAVQNIARLCGTVSADVAARLPRKPRAAAMAVGTGLGRAPLPPSRAQLNSPENPADSAIAA